MLRELIVTVTNRCNHFCAMCYYHDSINRKIKELSRDEFKKISLSLGNIDHLMISGGEPFLRKELPDICKIFGENNNVHSLFIPTNGSLPKTIVSGISDIFKMIPKVKLAVMLSLEGKEKTHDRIHDRRGAFSSVLQTIEKLNYLRLKLLKKNKLFSLLLNTVVTNQNIDEVIPLMQYIKENVWVDLHSFSPMRGVGRDPNYKSPTASSFKRLFVKAHPYFKYYIARGYFSQNRRAEYSKWLNRRYRLWIHILDGGKWPFPCQAGNNIGVLEPDGGVRLCELTPVVGNVREAQYNFKKVWFSKRADSIRAKIKKDNCACTHACFIDASEREHLASK